MSLLRRLLLRGDFLFTDVAQLALALPVRMGIATDEAELREVTTWVRRSTVSRG